MSILVRPAHSGDAPYIARVQVDSWRTTYAGIVPDSFLAELSIEIQTPKWLERLADSTMAAFVAEQGESIIAFATGGALRETVGSLEGELYSIYILKAAQGNGLGRTLVRSVAYALRDQGFQSMAVWVLERNPSAGFYQHLGGVLAAEKQIEIGGAMLTEIAFGWPTLDPLFA